MKKIKYDINNEGRVTRIGYFDAEFELIDEPFTIENAFNWRKENNNWIFDPIITVPLSITKFQLVKELLKRNRYNDLLAGLSVPEMSTTKILFDASHRFDTDSEMMQYISNILSLTNIDLNELLIEASKH